MEFAATGGFRNEHLGKLKKLLCAALYQNRFEEAKKLYEFLEKTVLADRDPLFLFQTGSELFMQEDHFDTKALRFFQAAGRKLKHSEHRILVLEATESYYVRHGRWTDAYDHLTGYLNSLPFSTSCSLHEMAAIIAVHLSQDDNRVVVKEKYLRRALIHFDNWLNLLLTSKASRATFGELNTLDAYLTALKMTGSMEMPQTVLNKLIGRFPPNLHLRIIQIEFLIEEEDGGRDRTRILELIQDVLDLSLKIGYPEPNQLIRQYCRTQLRNRKMKLEEYLKWLRCLFIIELCLDESDEARKIDFELQYEYVGAFEQWQSLLKSLPRLFP